MTSRCPAIKLGPTRKCCAQSFSEDYWPQRSWYGAWTRLQQMTPQKPSLPTSFSQVWRLPRRNHPPASTLRLSWNSRPGVIAALLRGNFTDCGSELSGPSRERQYCPSSRYCRSRDLISEVPDLCLAKWWRRGKTAKEGKERIERRRNQKAS